MDYLREFGRFGEEKGGVKDRRSRDSRVPFQRSFPRDQFSYVEGEFFLLKSGAPFINFNASRQLSLQVNLCWTFSLLRKK